jgi:tetratricopeptide (TPR) repeat protein
MYGITGLLHRTCGKELAQVPEIQKVRRVLGAYALDLLERFTRDEGVDPGSRLRRGLAYRHLASIHQVQGDPTQVERAYRQAVTVLEQLANDYPGDAFYWGEAGLTQHTFGLSLHRAGRPEATEQLRQARDKYLHAVQLSADTRAMNNCAWFLVTCPDLALRDPVKAVRLAETAVTRDWKSGRCRATLGLAYYRVGNWPGAVAAFQQALQLNPGIDLEDFYFLAMAYWQLGKKEEARRWYDETLRWEEGFRLPDDHGHSFRAEAAALLQINTRSGTKPESKPGGKARPGGQAATRGDNEAPGSGNRP